MSGLLLIGVVLLWFVVAIAIAQMLTAKLRDSWFKSLATLLAVAVLIPLPVVDEIIGGIQFRALCNREAVITYSKEKAYGRTVHLKKVDRFDLPKMVLPVHKEIWKYAEHISNEDLISYVNFYSDGGWLSRAINFNNVHRPYTFLGVCSGDKDDSVFQKLNIKKVDKSSGE